ncbi:MAG: hypothetical protein EOO81_06930 [Oxalobacteraceae bacterium]|nr:MAG: hypothetical protein EOO81_06930 [Oxalobacteraceae bacterium]
MGGANSGRRAGYGRRRTEGSTPLDIRKIAKSTWFHPGVHFSWEWTQAGRAVSSIDIEVEEGAVRLVHRNVRSDQVICQRLLIERTACHFGGSRPWFKCPGCTRRVAVVYGVGDYFACRVCYELPYESQAENAGDRSWKKAEQLRKRLGWPAGIANPELGRPKGMHMTTYRRIVLQYRALIGAVVRSILDKKDGASIPRPLAANDRRRQ